jgi:hypothetical protein
MLYIYACDCIETNVEINFNSVYVRTRSYVKKRVNGKQALECKKKGFLVYGLSRLSTFYSQRFGKHMANICQIGETKTWFRFGIG